jgi:hypothetical protein
MQQAPQPDSSEFAALMDFIATSGRTRSHPSISEDASRLVAQMWSDRAKAMTLSLTAVARATIRHNH